MRRIDRKSFVRYSEKSVITNQNNGKKSVRRVRKGDKSPNPTNTFASSIPTSLGGYGRKKATQAPSGVGISEQKELFILPLSKILLLPSHCSKPASEI